MSSKNDIGTHRTYSGNKYLCIGYKKGLGLKLQQLNRNGTNVKGAEPFWTRNSVKLNEQNKQEHQVHVGVNGGNIPFIATVIFFIDDVTVTSLVRVVYAKDITQATIDIGYWIKNREDSCIGCAMTLVSISQTTKEIATAITDALLKGV